MFNLRFIGSQVGRGGSIKYLSWVMSEQSSRLCPVYFEPCPDTQEKENN